MLFHLVKCKRIKFQVAWFQRYSLSVSDFYYLLLEECMTKSGGRTEVMAPQIFESDKGMKIFLDISARKRRYLKKWSSNKFKVQIDKIGD